MGAGNKKPLITGATAPLKTFAAPARKLQAPAVPRSDHKDAATASKMGNSLPVPKESMAVVPTKGAATDKKLPAATQSMLNQELSLARSKLSKLAQQLDKIEDATDLNVDVTSLHAECHLLTKKIDRLSSTVSAQVSQQQSKNVQSHVETDKKKISQETEEPFKVDGEQAILIDIIENYQEVSSENSKKQLSELEEEIAGSKDRSGSQGSGSSGNWVSEEPLDLTKLNLGGDDDSSPRAKQPSEPQYLSFLSNQLEQMDLRKAVTEIRSGVDEEVDFELPCQDQLIADYLEDAHQLFSDDKDAAYEPKFFTSARFSSIATLLERGENDHFIQRSMLKELVTRIGKETGGLITETEVKVVEIKTTELPKKVAKEELEPQRPSRFRHALSALKQWWLRQADEGRFGTLIDEDSEEDELAAIVLPYMQVLPKDSAASQLAIVKAVADVGNKDGVSVALSFEIKKRELQKKYTIKNNLHAIFEGTEDRRSEDWNTYFNQLGDILDAMPADNLKAFIKNKKKLTLRERNRLVMFHNLASDDEKYGSRLFTYASELVQERKLAEGDEERMLLLSVDWPIDIQMDPFHRAEGDSEGGL